MEHSLNLKPSLPWCRPNLFNVGTINAESCLYCNARGHETIGLAFRSNFSPPEILSSTMTPLFPKLQRSELPPTSNPTLPHPRDNNRIQHLPIRMHHHAHLQSLQQPLSRQVHLRIQTHPEPPAATDHEQGPLPHAPRHREHDPLLFGLRHAHQRGEVDDIESDEVFVFVLVPM